LSSGIELISKPSGLHVPPWQMVSATLDGVDLRTATWWATPKIPTTTSSTTIACWDSSLGTPGAVEIATTGQFGGKALGLQGVASSSGNHAKIGVSLSGTHHYAIFWRYEPARRSFWKLQQQPKRKRGFVLRD